jgi:hypothetical protein
MTDRMNDNALPHHLELDHVDYLSVFKDFVKASLSPKWPVRWFTTMKPLKYRRKANV